MPTNSVERASVILSLLGEEMTEQILSRLKPEQAERLRSARGAASSSRRLRETVLDDFERFFRFVEGQSGGQLRLHADDDSPDGGANRRPSSGPVLFDPAANPAEGLEQVTEFQIAGALESEPPRAAALLLSVLPPLRVADILAHLPVDQRDRIVPELGREQIAGSQVIDRLVSTVMKRAATVPAQGIERIDRIQRLADVLRAVQKPQRGEMLKTLVEHDPETAEAITEKLYIFDDLQTVNDRTVQKVLAEVDGTTMASALAGADDGLREKILTNLSRRARATLEEELEFQTNTPKSRIEAAQADVARALARVDQEAE